MRNLAVAIEDIDWNEDHSKLHAREIEVDHFDAVGEIDAEPVAGSEAPGGKKLRDAVAARIDFPESELPSLELEPDRIAAAFQRQVEQIAKSHYSILLSHPIMRAILRFRMQRYAL